MKSRSSEIITRWTQAIQWFKTVGRFTLHTSITIVTHGAVLPDYLHQRFLKQAAEEGGGQLIAGMLMDVDGMVWNGIQGCG